MNGVDPTEPRDRIHLEENSSASTWDYQPDPEVLELLEETERTETPAAQVIANLKQYTSDSPEVSGGDVDADWERDDDSGEESVGGSVVTPDQNRVEELGKAWGVTYQDDEPLHTIDKLEKRDKDRWELNPASQDET